MVNQIDWFSSSAQQTNAVKRVKNVIIESFKFGYSINNKINEPRRDKTNKVSVRPARSQISLGIRPV